jgi:hypothetical protein
MNRAATLEQLARLCGLNRDGVAAAAIEPSGLAELDAALPGGGWQSGTIVELMPLDMGIGELRLLMPVLARITATDRHAALISPPCIPFAPAFARHGVNLERLLVIKADKPADILWSFEQTLRCKSFAAGRGSRPQHRLHVSIAGRGMRSFAGRRALAPGSRPRRFAHRHPQMPRRSRGNIGADE